MPDPRFFTRTDSKTLGEIATLAGAPLPEGADANRLFNDVAPLHTATAKQVSFLENVKYRETFRQSRAGVCLIEEKEAIHAPAGMIVLICKYPYKSYARVAAAFYPEPQAEPGIHPMASVHPTAIIDATASIAAGAVIEAHVTIGAHTRIEGNAVISRSVTIGNHTTVGACASVSHALIGNNVVIYPGARIGQPGFGFAFDPEKPVKVPQLGRVIIHDDVEIGANSTIDRGAGPDTVIGQGTMIDNSVQIAHNVVLGRGCILAAHTGISGSTHVGDYVMMGGKAGLTGHLHIASGAKIAANSGVMRDVAAGEAVGGSPAFPMREWLRQQAALQRLARRNEGKKKQD